MSVFGRFSLKQWSFKTFIYLKMLHLLKIKSNN